MNKETQSIIRNLQSILSGEPRFGRAIYPILEEADESKVYTNPIGAEELMELLYHMITWAEFSLKQLENASPDEIKEIENRDWREINPNTHRWRNGKKQIMSILETKDDSFFFLKP